MQQPLAGVRYEPVDADGDHYPPLFEEMRPFLSSSVNVRCEDILNGLGVLIHGCLTEAECKSIIALSERTGYQKAKEFCHKYQDRWNDRFMTDDRELASFLWQRVKPHVPATLTFRGCQWEVVDLNTRFRFCRYRGEERHYFGPHTDGTFQVDETQMSILTCMFYLNDASEFEGGLTNFIDFHNTDKVLYSLKPEAGLCIAFVQDEVKTYHEGTMVTKGKKYIMRTDIFYRMVNKKAAKK